MKKTVKIISTILLIIMFITNIAGTVLAETDIGGIISGIQSSSNNAGEQSAIMGVGGRIIAIINVVGVVIAIVIILVLGLKYMIGSAEEKAEYKKTFIPYIVGAFLLFTGPTLVNVIYKTVRNVSGSDK